MIPGSLAQRGDTGGWYWYVIPPGETRRRGIPMKAVGALRATRLRAQAERIRAAMWARWTQAGVPEPVNLEREIAAYQRSRELAVSVAQARWSAQVVRWYYDAQAELTADGVREYLTAKGAAPGTLRKHLHALRRWGRWLQQRGLADDNPAVLVDAPRIYLPPPRFLSDDELSTLRVRLAGAPDWLRLAVETGLACGLRLGELRALRVGDVRDGHLVIGANSPTKTYRWRTVPVAKCLAGELKKNRAGRIFPARDARGWVRWLERFAQGIGPFGELPGRRAGNWWHLLRSTWAVNRARAGATLWELMAEAGWSSPQTAMRYVNIAATGSSSVP